MEGILHDGILTNKYNFGHFRLTDDLAVITGYDIIVNPYNGSPKLQPCEEGVSLSGAMAWRRG
jgi:hypothetical protein